MVPMRTVVPLALCAVALAQEQTPRELGDIAWLRDFEAAKKAATKVDKPLLLLFQEVPG